LIQEFTTSLLYDETATIVMRTRTDRNKRDPLLQSTKNIMNLNNQQRKKLRDDHRVLYYMRFRIVHQLRTEKQQ